MKLIKIKYWLMIKLTFHQFSVKILSKSEHCSLTLKFINWQRASHTNSIFWFADVTIKVSGNTERTLKTSRCQNGLVHVKVHMLHCLQKRFSANFAEPWGELASRLASEIAKFFVHQQFGCDHFYFHFLFTNLLITFSCINPYAYAAIFAYLNTAWTANIAFSKSDFLL